jgi:hypothetical protein
MCPPTPAHYRLLVEVRMKWSVMIAGVGLTVTTLAYATDEPRCVDYVPGLGEFMSSAQVHHAKLWFAGTQANWKLADFELDEIKETLEDAASFHPTDKNLPIGEMIKQKLEPTFAQLKKTIDGKDVGSFQTAYDLMTEACNTCHAATQHEFIRLQRPTAPPLTNQIYSPARK